MKEFIKKHKTKFMIATCILFFGIGIVSAETVATIFSSSEVSYSNENMDAANVQDAIDELYDIATAIGIPKLKEQVVTNNDGLYDETNVDGRYTYKGSNPNNYFTFNGETAGWRIVSIESDETIKIVKTKSLGNKAWDAANTRIASNNKYCTTVQWGCNAWAKTSALASTNSTIQTQLASGTFHQYYPNGGATGSYDYSGTVTEDASLNTYLNSDYYVNTLKRNENIEKHNFSVSSPGNTGDTQSLATNVEQEKLYTWKGYVGLVNITDYMRATTNNTCTTIDKSYGSGKESICGTNNWLKTGIKYWTISPCVYEYYSSRTGLFTVESSGYIKEGEAYNSYGVYPVVYLKSDIKLSGTGTSTTPYRIVG